MQNPLVAATIGKNERVTLTGTSTKFNLLAIKLADGSIYTGQWKNGVKDGKGTQKWESGSCYEGGFVDDKFNGKVSLIGFMRLG